MAAKHAATSYTERNKVTERACVKRMGKKETSLTFGTTVCSFNRQTKKELPRHHRCHRCRAIAAGADPDALTRVRFRVSWHHATQYHEHVKTPLRI